MRRVDYERVIGDADFGIEDCEVASVDEQRSLRAWLTTLGGRDTLRACSHQFEQSARWVGPWSLRHVVRSQQAQARREFAAMVQELKQRRLVQLAENEKLSPGIDLLLLDHRSNQAQPLPTEEWLLSELR